jgi:hypothetical protein
MFGIHVCINCKVLKVLERGYMLLFINILIL